MRLFGLIGHPVSHSFSKAYFENKFETENLKNCRYELFDLKNIETISHLKFLFPLLNGLNITIPHKESIIPFLDGISDEAKIIGAVNTIQILNGKWIGHNTDVYGFSESLKPLLNTNKPPALILGTGGASLAVKFVFDNLSIPYLMVSRQPVAGQIAYSEVDKKLLQKYKLIINTTPLGMFPNLDSSPHIPFEFITSSHVVYDLIYNPDLTKLLRIAQDKGCVVKNGLEMLHLQADKSWEIWNSIN